MTSPPAETATARCRSDARPFAGYKRADRRSRTIREHKARIDTRWGGNWAWAWRSGNPIRDGQYPHNCYSTPAMRQPRSKRAVQNEHLTRYPSPFEYAILKFAVSHMTFRHFEPVFSLTLNRFHFISHIETGRDTITRSALTTGIPVI